MVNPPVEEKLQKLNFLGYLRPGLGVFSLVLCDRLPDDPAEHHHHRSCLSGREGMPEEEQRCEEGEELSCCGDRCTGQGADISDLVT